MRLDSRPGGWGCWRCASGSSWIGVGLGSRRRAGAARGFSFSCGGCCLRAGSCILAPGLDHGRIGRRWFDKCSSVLPAFYQPVNGRCQHGRVGGAQPGGAVGGNVDGLGQRAGRTVALNPLGGFDGPLHRVVNVQADGLEVCHQADSARRCRGSRIVDPFGCLSSSRAKNSRQQTGQDNSSRNNGLSHDLM